jgi:hypothetical protein
VGNACDRHVVWDDLCVCMLAVCCHGSDVKRPRDLRAQTIQSCEIVMHITDRKYVFNVEVECGITLRTRVCFKSINVHEFEDVGKYHDALFIVYIIHRDTV